KLLDKLATLPALVVPVVRRRMWQSWKSVAAAAVIFAVIMAGLFWPWPGDDRPKNGTALAEEELMERVLQSEVRLAGTSEPKLQFVALAQMAEDISSETLRVAQANKQEDLPLLIGLYQ